MSDPEQGRQQHIIGDELNAYLDDAVLPAERERIDAHLANCADCRRQVHELRMIRDTMRALPQYDPPLSFQLGLEHARRPPETVPFRLLRLLPAVRVLAVAAVIAFMVTGGALVVDQGSRDENSGDQNPSLMVGSAPTSETSSGGAGTESGKQTSDTTEETAAGQARMGALPRSSGEAPASPIESGDSASSSARTPGEPASEFAPGSAQGTAVAEGTVVTPESTSDHNTPLSVQPVDGSTDTRGTLLIIAAIGLGLLAAFLIGFWVLLARTEHQRRTG